MRVFLCRCCIDKKSSAELSEAINSMYKWYGDSDTCIVYLDDVCPNFNEGTLERSEWFKRGWTLQELLASSPDKMMFYDAELSFLGTKLSLTSEISAATGIAEAYISDELRIFSSRSVATRLSWASRRKTTRIEDEAYCLLGLLEVNMPLLCTSGKRPFNLQIFTNDCIAFVQTARAIERSHVFNTRSSSSPMMSLFLLGPVRATGTHVSPPAACWQSHQELLRTQVKSRTRRFG